MVKCNLWEILSSSISLAVGNYNVLLFHFSYVTSLRHGLISLFHIDIEGYLVASIVPNKLQCVCVCVFGDCGGVCMWGIVFE